MTCQKWPGLSTTTFCRSYDVAIFVQITPATEREHWNINFLTTLETLAINFNHIFSNESTSIFPPPKRRKTCWLPPFLSQEKTNWRRSSFDIGTAEWHQDDSRASLYLTSFRVQSTNGADPKSTMASWMDNADIFPPPKLNEGWICREDPSPNIGYTGNV